MDRRIALGEDRDSSPSAEDAAAPRFEHAARLYAGLAVLIGVTGLVGWQLRLPVLTSIVPGFAPMKLGASLAVVVAGLCLLLLCGDQIGRARRVPAFALGLLLLGWGGLVLWHRLVRLPAFPSASLSAALDELGVGFNSTATGISFILLGAGVLDLSRFASGLRHAQPIALAGLAVGVLALTGYLYDTRAVYSIEAYASMPLMVAAAIVLLFAAMLICRPRGAWIAIFAGDGPANMLARRVLPWALLLPFVSGWIFLAAVRGGIISLAFGVTASTVFSALLISGIVWRTAYNANLSEAARRGTARALRRSDHLRSAVFEAVLDPLITLDRDGWIIEANMAARRALGIRSGNGRIDAFFAPGFPPPLSFPRNWDEEVALDRRTEAYWRRDDGTNFPGEISVSQTWPDGRQTLVLHIRDLTLQKSTETQLRQAQKMEAVGQLTGGLAHDFNNLLAIILGNLDLLSERLNDPTFREEFVRPAIAAAERGSQLTQRLLAFGRRQSLQPELTDVNALVEGTADMLRRTLGTGIGINTALAPTLWPARVDPGQLENALLNLGINARDAMDGDGRITIGTHNVAVDDADADAAVDMEPGDYVCLTVADSGAGMPPEVAARAFEPFFTTKEVGKGTGLGLSMVYGFIKQSGGHIRLTSEPGRGTTVTLYLPRSEPTLSSDAPNRDVGAMPASRGEAILVVEDDPDLLPVTVGMIEQLGYRTLTATTGAEALTVLAADPEIDLMFTDLVLPGGMNGLELALAAQSRWPRLKVLFTSGFAEIDVAEQQSIEAMLVRKPFRRAELASRLRQALQAEGQPG